MNSFVSGLGEPQNSVLHTKTSYAFQKINLKIAEDSLKINSITSSINNLKQKEASLYRKFGAEDYNDFKKKIVTLIEPKDAVILKKFSANNLNKELDRFALKSQDLNNLQVRYIFDFSNIPNVKLDFKSSRNFTIESNIEFEFSYNVGAEKKIMNDIFGRHFKIHNDSFTDELKALREALIAEGILKIQVKKEGTGSFSNTTYEDYQNIAIPNFPWGVTKKTIENARLMGEESTLYKKIVGAVLQIKEFIFNELGNGKSIDLQIAMEKVWNSKNIGDGIEKAIFFGGGENNFKNNVKGALGEFQAAVLFEYLNQKFNKVPNGGKISEIIGNQIRKGEQLKTDITLFRLFGFQIKNYTIREAKNGLPSYMKDIETNIHPADLAGRVEGLDANFLDFLANYYFNSSYQSSQIDNFLTIKEYLKNKLGEIMNLAVSDSIEDTVCFYFIDGQYLLPGSVILESARDNMMDIPISITGPSPIGDDDYFAEFESTSKGKLAPRFRHYWIPIGHIGWRLGKNNEKEYQELIEHSISIRTSFNPLQFISSYSLF